MKEMKDLFPRELINRQLHTLLNYGEIKNSLILSRFLSFVVGKTILGKEGEIKEYTIGVNGLGKTGDFNPQLDASVRIHAGRLRKILEQYYVGPGKNDEVRINIPKGSYVPVFKGRNDLGSNNSYDDPQPKGESHTISAGRYHKPLLAVLPFHNLSSDETKNYFVTGIGEQLSTDLARFQNISVISYYSTYNFDPALSNLQEMKKKVAVDYVLTGSVRFVNELVRLNVQLIQSETGQIVFTETYVRRLTPENIFDIQEEITGEILNTIADDNGVIAMNKTYAFVKKEENSNVQKAIYKYFDYTFDYAIEKFDPTIHQLEKAIIDEPHNALACSLLSSLYMFSYSTKKETDFSLIQKASELAATAVRLDPVCQHAYKALAWSFLLNKKKDKSLEAIEQCIKLNPKASGVISLMSLAYVCLGEYEKGFQWLLESMHLNSFMHASSKLGFTFYYLHTGYYEEGLRWIERLNTVETPLFSLVRLSLLGKIYKKKIEIDTGIAQLDKDAELIIDRMVFDMKLKTELMDGLKLAGLFDR